MVVGLVCHKRPLPPNLEGRSVWQVGRGVILGLSWVNYSRRQRTGKGLLSWERSWQAGKRGLGGAGSPSPGTNWPSGCREKSRPAAVADGQGLGAGGPLHGASPLVGNLGGRPPTEATGLLGLRTDPASGDGSAPGRAASVGRAEAGRPERGCTPSPPSAP